jgi:hypothetical protein
MASLTSESDSTTFAGEEMQPHLSYTTFSSLTSDMNHHVSQNPPVPTAPLEGMTDDTSTIGVRVHYLFILLLGCLSDSCQFPFVSSQ